MRTASILLTVFISISATAQVFPPANYPKAYFRNPLDIPISLSGNFGELRPNHYHMGWDIRTEKRQNLPVHAAAEGYIAKIKIEPAGFGRAIYINHPNGYTTVYCHLNDFYPALEAYVKQQQYLLNSWKVLLDVPANLFPVKKGDFIAYSGTTGGSQAPHLHFEIRKTDDDINRNPMLFGLPLPDNTVPTIKRLALYDRTKSIYEQSPRMVPVKKTATGYATLVPVITVTTPKISFAISASDTHSGSVNPNGIFEAVLYNNQQPVVGFQMDRIGYNDTRNLNAHIDYKTRANGGPFLQQLFELPGYNHSIYKKVSGDGAIDLSDGAVHHIAIEVKDAYGNITRLITGIQFKQPTVPPVKPLPAGKMFYPFMIDGFESGDCEFYLGEKSLYDSVHIAYQRTISSSPNAISAVHSIGAVYIPLQDPMMVRIQPTVVPDAVKRNRVVMQWFDKNKTEVEKVDWQKGWATAAFRTMGNFQLLVDEEPPVIVPVGFTEGANMSKASRIVFIVKDNLESFKNFRAELDGKWLRFTNDKGKSFIYTFDEKCPAGPHSLKLSVEDEAGNVTVKTYSFTR